MSNEPDKVANDEWDVEDVEVGRPVSVVVSVRLPGELADRLTLEAASNNVPVSSLIREAVGHFLEAAENARANNELTVSSNHVGVVFYAGRRLQGHTAGPAQPFEEALTSSR